MFNGEFLMRWWSFFWICENLWSHRDLLTSSTEAWRSTSSMDGIFLHALHQPLSRHRNFMGFIAEFKFIGKSHDVETGICNGTESDANSVDVVANEVEAGEMVKETLVDAWTWLSTNQMNLFKFKSLRKAEKRYLLYLLTSENSSIIFRSGEARRRIEQTI